MVWGETNSFHFTTNKEDNMTIQRIEQYSFEAIEMQERATDRFSSEENKESHREITISCVNRLCWALSTVDLSHDEIDYYQVKKALWIGQKYNIDKCTDYLSKIADIEKAKEQEIINKENMQDLQEILDMEIEDICEGAKIEMFELVNKLGKHMSKEQWERSDEIAIKLSDCHEEQQRIETRSLYRVYDEDTLLECSICTDTFQGFGHNAEPVMGGRCCNTCNTKYVLPRRIKQFLNQ